MVKKIKCDFTFMNHWGHFAILPSLDMVVTYAFPTFVFEWMVFRIDIKLYYKLPDWFMHHVWSWMNFDFIKKEEDD